MTTNQPEQHATPEIPVVDESVLAALRNDFETDPGFEDQLFHDLNESHHELVIQTVIEGNRRSGGDITKQADFVHGAEFVLGALKRQADTTELNQQFAQDALAEESTPGSTVVPISTDSEQEVPDEVHKHFKRWRLGHAAAADSDRTAS